MSDASTQLSRFAALRGLGNADLSSEDRRALLRQVTETLSTAAPESAPAAVAEFDEALAQSSADYSKLVRVEIARLVAAHSGLAKVANAFAFDDIEVAGPILRHSSCLSDATLLRVVQEQGQDHMLAITKRAHVSEAISEALVEKGNDGVVSSLLENDRARIGQETYGRIATRAESSAALQGPLVRRQGVPAELLNTIYLKAEAGLKREILEKMANIPPAEMEQAFARAKARVTNQYARPADFKEAQRRVDTLERVGILKPSTLVDMLREGKASRTAFKLAFARLTQMELDLIERVVEGHDIDTVALLCRGCGMERAVFVTLAVTLDADPKAAQGRAAELMALYDSVPVAAAERALRFWKIKAAA
jgi:uncharacterized protein (DUF2336 family)